MRLGILAFAALAVTAAEPPAPFTESEFQSRLERTIPWCRAERVTVNVLEGALGVTPTCALLLGSEEFGSFASLSSAVASRNGIREEAAERLVEAALRRDEPSSDKAARAYVAAARLAKGALVVTADLISSGLPDDGVYADVLRSAPDPLLHAERFLAALPQEVSHAAPWAIAFRAGMLAARRELRAGAVDAAGLGPVDRGADIYRREDLPAAAVDLVLLDRKLDAGMQPPGLVPVAARLLATVTGAGLPLLAAKVYGRLPADSRVEVVTALSRYDDNRTGALAVALLLAGENKGAEMVLSSASGQGLNENVARAVLEHRLDDLVGIFSDFTVEVEPSLGLLVSRELLHRDPEAASTFYHLRRDHPFNVSGRSVCALVPEGCLILQRAAHDGADLAERVAAHLPNRTETPQEARVTRTIARMLERPLSSPFTVRSLPTSTSVRLVPPNAEPSEATDRPTVSPDLKNPIRTERIGDHTYSIVANNDLDTPFTSGGYWLLDRGPDGRETKTYLGLRVNMPYLVSPTSRVPLVDKGVLRLEATVAETDGNPFGENCDSRIFAWGGPVLLEARLEDLRRDSDGDGLTDLEEERLLTDPFDPDTDHDGIPDGQDPLPNVPSGPMTERGKILNAVLTELPWPYVIGAREDFRGIHVGTRTIVLTPDEFLRAEARFGPFNALNISALEVGPKSARVAWNQICNGGFAIFSWRGRGWHYRTGSSWGD